MDQNHRYNRTSTKVYSLELTKDEIFPQMIVQMILKMRQLSQLAATPLLLDYGQRDLVDSKV